MVLFVWINVSVVIMMFIQKPVLLSVRFDSISTGHWINVFKCNHAVNIKACVAISTF